MRKSLVRVVLATACLFPNLDSASSAQPGGAGFKGTETGLPQERLPSRHALVGEVVPNRNVLAPRSGLKIAGLSRMMIGWQQVEAIGSREEIDHVVWRVNGRQVPSKDSFSARLYFGRTPQPRDVEALAYDQLGKLQYTAKATVNAGGRARVVDFLNPSDGEKVRGNAEVRLCVYSPPDELVDRVLVEYTVVGEPESLTLEAKPHERSHCRQGSLHTATVPFSRHAAILTAKLVSRVQGVNRPPEPAFERSIFVNAPPSISETIDVRLLEWPVQVSRKSRPIGDLDASHFVLSEDGVPCTIEKVLTAAETPFRLGLVLDWSGSTALDLRVEAMAAAELIEGVFDPKKDLLQISAISRSPIPYLPWTSDWSEIETALEHLSTGASLRGGTAVYDTLVHALYEFQNGRNEGLPALILMTDGVDTTSAEFNRAQALAYARESGVRIYPLAVQARITDYQVTEIDHEFLAALASATGGTLSTVTIDGRSVHLATEAKRLRQEATSLEENPGELAEDPRFLAHLIAEREKEAGKLEQRAAALEAKAGSPLEVIREAMQVVREDLSSGYVLVARSRAERADRWHPVEVKVGDFALERGFEVRTARGFYW